METHVYVLAPSRTKSVLSQPYGQLIILKATQTPDTHDPLSSERVNNNTAPVNKTGFAP